jgi:hypothetical protein
MLKFIRHRYLGQIIATEADVYHIDNISVTSLGVVFQAHRCKEDATMQFSRIKLELGLYFGLRGQVTWLMR